MQPYRVHFMCKNERESYQKEKVVPHFSIPSKHKQQRQPTYSKANHLKHAKRNAAIYGMKTKQLVQLKVQLLKELEKRAG